MINDIVHTVRIDVDAALTDLAGDGEPSWSAFLGRHPGLAPDAARMRRLRALTSGLATTAAVSRLEWPSMSDYGAAVAGDADALEVSRLLDDGPLSTTDGAVSAAAQRANGHAIEPLFSVRHHPLVRISYARIATPPALVRLAAALRPGVPRSIWPDPFVHCPDAEPMVAHLLLPGAVQNLRRILADRIVALGLLEGLEIVVGDHPASEPRRTARLRALAARFLQRYEARLSVDGCHLLVDDADPVPTATVAADYVAYERAQGFDLLATRAELDDLELAYVGQDARRNATRTVLEACSDPTIVAPARRGLAY